jgi:hypothetical protein
VFVAVAGGYFWSILNCEYQSCEDGSPSWAEPWTWGDYYVHPAPLFIGLVALAAATLFVGLVFKSRRLLAALALGLTLLLLTYPYFSGFEARVPRAGLDKTEARVLFSIGPLLGVAALLTLRRRAPLS